MGSLGISVNIVSGPALAGAMSAPTNANPLPAIPSGLLSDTQACLTLAQVSALRAANESGGYIVRIFSKGCGGKDRLAVLMGESHAKLDRSVADAGIEVVRSFPVRGCESGPLFLKKGDNERNRDPVTWRPFTVLKPRLWGLKASVPFGSTIEALQLESLNPAQLGAVRRRLARALGRCRGATDIHADIVLRAGAYSRAVNLSIDDARSFLDGNDSFVNNGQLFHPLEEGNGLMMAMESSVALKRFVGPALMLGIGQVAGGYSPILGFAGLAVGTLWLMGASLKPVLLVALQFTDFYDKERDKVMAKNIDKVVCQTGVDAGNSLFVFGAYHMLGIAPLMTGYYGFKEISLEDALGRGLRPNLLARSQIPHQLGEIRIPGVFEELA